MKTLKEYKEEQMKDAAFAREYENVQNAFYTLREQAAEVPEMSLDEINAEISAARTERKR